MAKPGGARKRLKKRIRQILTLRSGSAIRFELDYLKIQHPLIFNDCVASILNEFGRKNILNLDGVSGQTLWKQ